MKKACIVSIVLIVALAVSMIATRPNANDHITVLQEVFHNAVANRVDEVMPEESIRKSVFKLVNQLMRPSSEFALERFLRVEDYWLFTLGYLDFQSEPKLISVGVFGHVFAPSEEDIEKLMKKYGL